MGYRNNGKSSLFCFIEKRPFLGGGVFQNMLSKILVFIMAEIIYRRVIINLRY